jgi:hypothetical protein
MKIFVRLATMAICFVVTARLGQALCSDESQDVSVRVDRMERNNDGAVSVVVSVHNKSDSPVYIFDGLRGDVVGEYQSELPFGGATARFGLPPDIIPLHIKRIDPKGMLTIGLTMPGEKDCLLYKASLAIYYGADSKDFLLKNRQRLKRSRPLILCLANQHD